LPFYALYQSHAYLTSNGYVVPHGPVAHFRVVGFEVSTADFPTSSPGYSLFTSKKFDQTMGRTVVRAAFAQVRLRHGQNDMPLLQVYSNHHRGKGFVYLLNEDTSSASIEQSIQPQATGWWFFALFAVLAGLALVGQALSRQSLVERDSYPTLSALGLRPRQLIGLGLLRAAAIGVVGAFGSVALAVAVSLKNPDQLLL
jgi:hypothetical protein